MTFCCRFFSSAGKSQAISYMLKQRPVMGRGRKRGREPCPLTTLISVLLALLLSAPRFPVCIDLTFLRVP